MTNLEYISILINLTGLLFLLGLTYNSIKGIVNQKRNNTIRESSGYKLYSQKIRLFIAWLIVILGWTGGSFLEKNKDREIRNHLVNTASLIADGINPRLVATFTYSSDDLKNPAYLLFNKQLMLAGRLLNGLEIFTLHQKENQYVLGPMGSDIDTASDLFPGAIYTNAPVILEEVFLNKVHQTTGPYFDGKESVLTAFANVLSPFSTSTILVVGIKMTEKNWKSEITKARLLPRFLAICLLFMLWIYSIFFSHKRLTGLYGTLWWRNPGAIFTLFFGIIVTGIISTYIIKAENEFRRTIFNQMTLVQSSQIKFYIRNLSFMMGSASNAIQSSESLDENTFNKIVTPLFNNNYILKTGLAILPDGKNGDNTSDPIINFAAPSFEFPFVKGKPFPKLTTETAELIHQLLPTKLNGFDGPFLMPESSSDAICFYYPVTLSSLENRQGLFFVVVEPRILLAESITVQGPGKAFFEIHYVLEQEKSAGKSIATYPHLVEPWNDKKGLHSVYPQMVFGRTFSFHFRPGKMFLDAHPSLANKLSPLAGLILTVLLSFFVGSNSTRKARLEKEIKARTHQLELSETRFARLFSSMTEGAALHEVIRDEHGKIIDFIIVDANPVYLKLWDLKKEEIIGKTSRDIFNQNITFPFDLISDVVNTKTAAQFEYHHPFNHRDLHISYTPWGENGFAGVFTDFSERKKTEQALMKSEQRYRMISENVADVIWIYNLESDRFTYLSPSAQKVFGYSVEDFTNLGLKDILTKKSFDYINKIIPVSIQNYEEGIKPDSVKVNSLDQLRKDGTAIHTEVVTSLISNTKGKVIEILGVTRDISEKVISQKALEKSEEKYRLLIENQQDLIIKVDQEGRYLFASNSFYKTFGKEEASILGQIYMPQMHEDDVEPSLRALTELMNPPYKVSFHQRVKAISGWIWLAWKNNAVFDENNKITGFIGVGRDITKQKEYELELIESREKLQSQNEEVAMLNEEYMALNEELRCTNEELVQAVDKAKESENLKTAFLQNMSHEIRTPLNAVIGFSEMLSLTDLSDEDTHDYAEIIVNSSRHLLGIVDDILTISTLETRQEKVKMSLVPINMLIKELDTVFRPRAYSKGIELNAFTPTDSDKIVLDTDEMKLKQVLNNLIGNAIKFTYEGSVNFGYEKLEHKIRFFVKDTGIGIPKNSLDLIFERFRQAENNDTSKHGGTGLGLAISKGHIELMGGIIWVESEVGKGSHFIFELPTNKETYTVEY